MFSKVERIPFSTDVSTALSAVKAVFASVSFEETPTSLLGRAARTQWGLDPRIKVTVNGTMLEMQIVSEIPQDTVMWILVMLVFFWPLLAVTGFLAWQDFQGSCDRAFLQVRGKMIPG